MSAQQAWEHLIASGLEVKCLLLAYMDRLSHTLYQLSSRPYCCDLISLFMSFLIIFPSLWKGKWDRGCFTPLRVPYTEECGLHPICWDAGLNHHSCHFKLLINCSAKKCTYFLGVICVARAYNLQRAKWRGKTTKLPSRRPNPTTGKEIALVVFCLESLIV